MFLKGLLISMIQTVYAAFAPQKEEVPRWKLETS
jgi:hypothetical protein